MSQREFAYKAFGACGKIDIAAIHALICESKNQSRDTL